MSLPVSTVAWCEARKHVPADCSTNACHCWGQVRRMQLACVLQGRHRGAPVTAVSWCAVQLALQAPAQLSCTVRRQCPSWAESVFVLLSACVWHLACALYWPRSALQQKSRPICCAASDLLQQRQMTMRAFPAPPCPTPCFPATCVPACLHAALRQVEAVPQATHFN